jgi:hypothetical protein
MSERKHDEARHSRPPVPEYDRFGFRGHFEPSCGPSEDRSSVDIYSELNREPPNS